MSIVVVFNGNPRVFNLGAPTKDIHCTSFMNPRHAANRPEREPHRVHAFRFDQMHQDDAEILLAALDEAFSGL